MNTRGKTGETCSPSGARSKDVRTPDEVNGLLEWVRKLKTYQGLVELRMSRYMEFSITLVASPLRMKVRLVVLPYTYIFYECVIRYHYGTLSVLVSQLRDMAPTADGSRSSDLRKGHNCLLTRAAREEGRTTPLSVDGNLAALRPVNANSASYSTQIALILTSPRSINYSIFRR
jgi:hypothetical protein